MPPPPTDLTGRGQGYGDSDNSSKAALYKLEDIVNVIVFECWA